MDTVDIQTLLAIIGQYVVENIMLRKKLAELQQNKDGKHGG